ncbi:MAG: hypothetical protein V1670_02955 [Candidatus Omnitrophota bacterium]
MTVKNILELESTNTNNIFLLKEGIFYRAYNRSAMFMVTTIFPYKVHKKWVKNVGEYIYYCGFPQQNLVKVKQKALPNNYSISNEDEKRLTIANIIANHSYEEWQKKQNAVYPIGQISNGAKEEQVKSSRVKEIDIIEKIRAYPLANYTPIETMQFVMQLQKELAVK